MARRKKQPRQGHRSHQQQQPKAKPQPPAAPPVIANAVQSNAGNPPQPPASKGPADGENNRKRPPIWRFVFAAVELALAAAIMVFTGFQAYLSDGQLAEMQSQNKIMQEQIRQTNESLKLTREGQRPWLTVAVKPIDSLDLLAKPGMTGEEFQVWFSKWAVIVKNVGQTPALNVRWRTDWHPEAVKKKVYEFDTAYWRHETTRLAIEQWFDGDPTPIDLTIAPEDSVVCRVNWRKRGNSMMFLPSRDHDERVRNFFQSRITAAFVYLDIWGMEHRLFCCFRHDPKTGQLELEDCSVDYPYDVEAEWTEPPKNPLEDVDATAEKLLEPSSDGFLEDWLTK